MELNEDRSGFMSSLCVHMLLVLGFAFYLRIASSSWEHMGSIFQATLTMSTTFFYSSTHYLCLLINHYDTIRQSFVYLQNCFVVSA